MTEIFKTFLPCPILIYLVGGVGTDNVRVENLFVGQDGRRPWLDDYATDGDRIGIVGWVEVVPG